jgi:mevalonate kinase
MNNFFLSKILLFGEYGVIHGSDALAIPFDNFSGTLSFDRNYDSKSNKDLKSFSSYLDKYITKSDLFSMDIEAFKFDIDQGLVFKSTIPQGYGLGSSGALCASVFEKYNKNQIRRDNTFSSNDLINLKEYLAIMESHFHGKSSGIEPLISFVSRPILFKDEIDIKIVELPCKTENCFFIIDTGRSRSTEPLVNLYFEKLKDKTFLDICEIQLKHAINSCIKAFFVNDSSSLFGLFSELSQIQFENFEPMIPPLYRALWKEGLESNYFSLKLCGAGGGGFLIGITKDIEKFKSLHPKESIRVLSI